MMKMKVSDPKCRVVMRKHLGGSVLKGTVFNRWEGITTYLTVDSDEPADKLAHLIKNAKAGCFSPTTQRMPWAEFTEKPKMAAAN